MPKKTRKVRKARNNSSKPIIKRASSSFTRKKRFQNFKELAEYSKMVTYFIVRIRGGMYIPLGTGFLAGRGRMATCAHCIDSTKDSPDALESHEDGDLYLFIQKDEDGTFHRFGFTDVIRNTHLYVYPEIDLAVFELPDDFYIVDGQQYKDPEHYLELSTSHFNIGTEISILGYPLPNLTFDTQGLPDLTDVHIRGDNGVVNTRYIKDGVELYEFTTAFNPGNSGGPILNSHTGEVLGLVYAYNPVIINYKQDVIPAGTFDSIEDVTQVSVLRTTYSIGVSARNYATPITTHNLATRTS